MFTKSIFISFLFIIFISNNLFSQDPPIEWEEIPIEDLKMNSYPADTSASALILCDYGFSTFNNELHLEFERHTRIKIFNEKGYGQAEFRVNLYNDIEYVDEIEGITYWLNQEGEIEEAELDEDDILQEKVSESRTAYKFTLPGLKPGCIIDVRYKVITKNVAMVRDWIFQYSEPVRWSEYRLEHLKNFAYSAVIRGYEDFYINEVTSTTKVISGRALSYSQNPISDCNLMRWVIKDAPAVREEAYITCSDDYKNRVDIQLAGWALPEHGVETISTTWNDFVKETLEDKYSILKISNSGTIEDLASQLTSGITDPEEKIKAIHSWVSHSIVWSGKNSRYPENDMDDVIELKKGNSADINLLMISLLKSAGLKCEPVILSTRANGKIQDLYPISHQFNYVIARVNAKSKYYFLDATNPLRPYDLLPSKILAVKALVIKEGPVEWTSIKCDKKNTTTEFINININNDGGIHGYFEQSFGEYESLGLRDDLSGGNEKDVVKKMLETELYGFEIDSLTIINKDSIHNPLKILTYVNSPNYAQANGDLIYLNPNMVFRMKENPFKTAKRKFPVDYGYKRSSNQVIKIIIPENYEVRELIKNKHLSVADIVYSRKVLQEGNEMQITCNFDIKNTEVKPGNYEKLREFYSQILSAQSEQIVLAKKSN